ncbi:MAG: NAD(P)H-hydrate dehydratase, partial [Anaerolineae bacterium]
LRQVQDALEEAHGHPLTVLNRPSDRANAKPFVVAIDGPSGMDFDSGEVDPLTLTAQLTVTFANPKQGHFRFPAAEHVGELVVADIGIPEEIDIPAAGLEVLTPERVRGWLPSRPADAHKGTFGKALIVAGSMNYTGAAGLAATAAVRTGAGLVTLGLAGALHNAIVPLVPEATYLILPSVLGAITGDAIQILEDHFEDYDALLVGPGLGQAEETVGFIRSLFGLTTGKRAPGFLTSEPSSNEKKNRSRRPPLILDADGLNILSRLDDWPTLLPPGTILTPHPGEMSRLTGKSIGEIEAHRWGTAIEYAERWGQVIILKGAFTVIASPEGEAVLLPFANAGLASAGTGDVLAGAVVALRAQGLGAFRAAAAGAFLHGLAGELARRYQGKTGMAARDVAQSLPEALYRLTGE